MKSSLEPEVLKYGPSLRGPFVETEGLVFHGTARAIRLKNRLLNDNNEKIPRTQPELADNFPKNYFSRIFSKIILPNFCIDFQVFRMLSKNFQSISRKIIVLPKTFFRVFITIRISPRILRQTWLSYVLKFVQLNRSGRMLLSCPMISQSDCKRAKQDE